MNKSEEKKSKLIIVLLVVYLLLLVGVILFKLPFYSPELSDGVRVINLIPILGSADENGVIVWREIIYNVLLFVPLGVYAYVLWRDQPLVRLVLVIAGVSLLFEVVQFAFALGRSDITDLLSNSLGGIIGLGTAALLFKILKDNARVAITVAAAIATIGFVLWFSQLFYLSHFVMAQAQI